MGIAPLAAHPVSKGVLCPYAFGAHQLPYHAARITQPLHKGTPILPKTAVSEIAGVKAGSIAIVDERPGRAVSAAYQKIAAACGGTYVVADRNEAATLQQIAGRSGLNAADLGFDLEQVRTIVSFGAPVLESWATPGRVLTLWKEKRLNVVQVEERLSKTAALASQWLQNMDAFQQVLPSIREKGPFLAVSGGGFLEADEQAVAALNEGSNAIVRRSAPPAIPATRLASVPNDSIDILFIDHGPLGGSLPIDVLRSKLRFNGIIVSFSPYRAGAAALADYLIPAPAFAECLDEAPTPWDAAVPSYATAPALLGRRAGTIHPLEFINRIVGGEATPESVIRGRVDALFAARHGEVFAFADGSRKAVSEFKSADDLWKAFSAGACWIDESARPVPVRYRPGAGTPVTTATTFTRKPAVAPPLFTKLDQESRIGRA